MHIVGKKLHDVSREGFEERTRIRVAIAFVLVSPGIGGYDFGVDFFLSFSSIFFFN